MSTGAVPAVGEQADLRPALLSGRAGLVPGARERAQRRLGLRTVYVDAGYHIVD